MTWIQSAGLLLGVAGLAAMPRVAHAITVQCSTPWGACEVSNEPSSIVTCLCDAGASDEAGGGNEWAGLTEEELLEVCNDHLSLCEAPGTTGGTTGSADTGAWSSDTGAIDSGSADTGSTSGSDDSGTTASDDVGPTGTDGGSTGIGGGASTGDGTTSGDVPGSTGEATGPGMTDGEGGSPVSAGDAGASSEGDGGGTGDPGAGDGGGGCGCHVERGAPSGWAIALVLAGLVGWRRRAI